MSTTTEIDRTGYADPLSKTLPHVIHTEAENTQYTAVLEALLYKPDKTPEENMLRELLTLLIEDFEAKHYPLPPASPRDMLRHIMEASGLQQSDLLDVFGDASAVAEVLSGKRALSEAHISKLSEKFHVSPHLFSSADPPAK